MTSLQRTLPDRAIESSLLAALLVHVIALGAMALMLLPAMPGAGRATPELRFAYVQAHPLLWHLGWLPWHLSAVSDLLLSAALFRAKWIPRRASLPTLIFTLVAFAIEQFYETLWDVFAPGFHPAASPLGGFPNYAAFEHHVFVPVCCVAAAVYAVMAMGWSWSLSAAPTWNRWLTAISWIAWPVLLFAAGTPLLSASLHAPNGVVNTANQAGFALMTVWFVLASEAVLRRTRVDEASGRMTPWRAPVSKKKSAGIRGSGLTRWMQETLANSRLVQYIAEFLPKPVLSSHIHDVVYLNYLVDAERAASLLPAGLELQTLGPEGRLTLFSILAYRHGRFGPSALGGGASCRAFPSPVQSNWRLYVRDAATGEAGIYFVTTTLSRLSAALLARMLSRGVPMHAPESSIVAATYLSLGQQGQSATVQLAIAPGRGSAPDLSALLESVANLPALPAGEWSTCFQSYEDFIEYAVPQDRALSVQSWDGRVTAQEINLPVLPENCLPLVGHADSAYLHALCGDEQPVCFLLPEVHFTMLGERVLHPGRCLDDRRT